MNKVYYHSPCLDGLTAAAIAKKALKIATFIPYDYKALPSFDDITVNDVLYFIDCAPTIETLGKISHAKKIVILDHHKSRSLEYQSVGNNPRAEIYFDMNRSGAGLAWDHFFPNEYRHIIVNLVEDNDLWLFKYGSVTESFVAYLDSVELTIDYIYYILCLNEKDWRDTYEFMLSEGGAIVRFRDSLIETLLPLAQNDNIDGIPFMRISCPLWQLTSALGNKMCEKYNMPAEVVVDFMQDGELKPKTSLRSTDKIGVDVSLIAKKHGGGGHKNAASFISEYEWH